jgi:hypothetical protein
VETHADFPLFELHFADIFYRGDVLLRRRFVSETFCYRRRSVTETFCYETFCMETFWRGDVLCGDVLYVRHCKDEKKKLQSFVKLPVKPTLT